jgi:LuxR family maltose regulon positive regulatory protein
MPGLHLSAAHWLSEHGYVLEAIRHAQASDDHDLFVSLLIEHYFTLMLDGQQQRVRTLLDVAVGRSSTPELAAVLAADELIGGSLDQAGAHLTMADRRANEVPKDRRDRFEMMLYVTRLSLARRLGDFQSVLDAPQPASLYSEPLSSADLAMQSDVRALMLMNLGIVEVWSGRRKDGEVHLTAAHEMARQIGRPYLEASCLAHQAQSLTWRSFVDARPVAEQALVAAERHGWQGDPVTGASLVVLGSCMVATGMIAEAERTFSRADEALRSELEPTIGFVLHTGYGVVNLVQASYPEAIAHFREAERLGSRLATSSPLALQSKCGVAYAAVLAGDLDLADRALNEFTETEKSSGEVREVIAVRALAEGDAYAALMALEPTVNETMAVHHGLVLIRSLLLAARAHYLLDEESEAQRSVERALGLAEADELIVPFLWVDSAELLERHPRHQTSHAAFLAAIMDLLSGRSFDRGVSSPPSADVALSDTELRVLRFLPTNLTAAEIASEIYVSVNTVKTHMRNIYTKLDAHSRGEAVEYARASGLLSHGVRSG